MLADVQRSSVKVTLLGLAKVSLLLIVTVSDDFHYKKKVLFGTKKLSLLVIVIVTGVTVTEVLCIFSHGLLQD